MKKNFSIDKIYSDLEKYQANLNGLKDSRLKKQASGSSFYQRPASVHRKNYQSRQSFGASNLSKYQKTRLEVGVNKRVPRQTFQKYGGYQKKSFLDNQDSQNWNSQKSSILKQNPKPNCEYKQNLQCQVKFNKKDQQLFLKQCNKLYNIKSKPTNTLTAQQEADSVKNLLVQINKRDKIYDVVTKMFGNDKTQQKLSQFFNKYNKMVKIVNEFKKMSKLDIQNDDELYDFLINQQQKQETRHEQS